MALRSLGTWWASLVSIATGDIDDAAITSPKMDEKLIRYAEVSIAAAAVATLRATPVTLVAAPGAGKILEFVSAEIFLDYTAPAYTESTDNLAIRYTGTTGTIVSQAIEAGGVADATGDTKTNALPKIDAISAKAACENQALVLHNTGDGEWGNSGGSAIRVKTAYRVHTTSW